jgi:hypothetical protein
VLSVAHYISFIGSEKLSKSNQIKLLRHWWVFLLHGKEPGYTQHHAACYLVVAADPSLHRLRSGKFSGKFIFLKGVPN